MRTPRPWSLPREPAGLSTLLASGVTREMLETQMRTGQLVRLRPGVYLATDSWPEEAAAQHLILAHAEQVAHPSAVQSHGTAALAWGLPSPRRDWWEDPVTVTLPRADGYRATRGQARHRTGSLPAHHIAKDADGFAVTTVARTAVDLACAHALPEALVLLDAAERQLVSTFVVNPRRADFASPRLAKAARDVLTEVSRTCRVARLAVALELADPRRETPIESLSAGHIHLAGLPAPEYQAAIRTPRGVYYPDFFWPQARLIGEADGAVKYADQRSIVLEKEREQVLIDLGFRFVRWLGKEIRLTPEVVVARIARALGI